MNRYFTLFLFSVLTLSSFSLSATPLKDENEGEEQKSSVTKPTIQQKEIEEGTEQSQVTSDTIAYISQIDLYTLVDALKKEQLITIGDHEYAVLKEDPRFESVAHGGDFVSGNPCYEGGLGPKLLKVKDIDNLPPQFVKWSYQSSRMIEYEESTYITIRYTSHNNPHWSNRFTYPNPFNELEKRYWNHEDNSISVFPNRTVNFLLKRKQTRLCRHLKK